MRYWFLLLAIFISLFSLNFISAICDSGQIDINTASLSELDELSGIGPVKAQAIIDSRPFSSVNDLLKVSGIGNATLAKIKTQGLACVNAEKGSGNNEEAKENVTVKVEANSSYNSSNYINYNNMSVQNAELKPINLNPKAINMDENSQSSDVNGTSYPLAFYGLIAFGILLGILFLIKTIAERRKQRNELQ